MKLGHEIEGRLIGLNTLFMNAEEFLGFESISALFETAVARHTTYLEADSLKAVSYDRAYVKAKYKSISERMLRGVQHLYISDHAGALTGYEKNLTESFEQGYMVTIEIRDQYSLKYRAPNVTVMLSAVDGSPSNSLFYQLLPTDQVKFSRETAKGHEVYCVTKSQMVYTKPEDFENDVTLGAPQ